MDYFPRIKKNKSSDVTNEGRQNGSGANALNKYISGLELGDKPHMTVMDMDIHHIISQPNFAQDDAFKKTLTTVP